MQCGAGHYALTVALAISETETVRTFTLPALPGRYDYWIAPVSGIEAIPPVGRALALAASGRGFVVTGRAATMTNSKRRGRSGK